MKKAVVLNGEISGLKKSNSGVSQEMVLGTFLFLIYINGLPDGTTSMCKIFADNTSLTNINKSVTELNT